MSDFILNIFRFCAVPFGFVGAVMDSGSTDETADDCASSRDRDYIIDFLPDILLGTVPFADPRQVTRGASSSSAPPIDPGEKDVRGTILPTGDPAEGAEAEGEKEERKREGSQETTHRNSIGNGVERIQEIRRRYRCVRQPTAPSGGSIGNPQVRLRRLREAADGRTGLRLDVDEGQNTQNDVRSHCGSLLRQIADQFERENAKIPTTTAAATANKEESAGTAILTISVPTALTSCLTASLLCLVWWRLYTGSANIYIYIYIYIIYIYIYIYIYNFCEMEPCLYLKTRRNLDQEVICPQKNESNISA
ncbi:uncharacterized protein LOC135205372 [Macrobrachium nipponense]|uniref:uncharacterized protein LOC135205372 n=1 Tax=Macrobrachium nipponense TaxID=159736 RepID=UPI0030C7D5C5